MLFDFSIGGYPGPFFRLEVMNGCLRCSHSETTEDQPKVEDISIIGNAKWNDLITFLAAQKWEAQYVDEGIVDGTGWSLEVNSATINIQSSGSNAYPPGFKEFLRLLNGVTAEKGITVG
jgi:hypothetical protein